jgi:hypothetical protein
MDSNLDEHFDLLARDLTGANHWTRTKSAGLSRPAFQARAGPRASMTASAYEDQSSGSTAGASWANCRSPRYAAYASTAFALACDAVSPSSP